MVSGQLWTVVIHGQRVVVFGLGRTSSRSTDGENWEFGSDVQLGTIFSTTSWFTVCTMTLTSGSSSNGELTLGPLSCIVSLTFVRRLGGQCRGSEVRKWYGCLKGPWHPFPYKGRTVAICFW